jgi:ABC-type multidrug transport system fused ATPase/permease subunit
VCFARALLRKTKILVLDEATSSIDLETDEAVQAILRGSDFKGVTTITIAHRLNTIMDSDRVLVMADGRVAEYDTPDKLLENEQSVFYGLVHEAGLGNKA